MSKFKFICLDIDGTLLSLKHQVTEKTRCIINRVVNEKHIPVVLVSERMPKGILLLQRELGICEPIICYSGSLILYKNLEILQSNYIDASYIKEIFAVQNCSIFTVQNCGIHTSLYKDDDWYVEKMDEWALQEKKITNINPIISHYDQFLKKWEEHNEGCNKIVCMGKPEQIQMLKDILKEIFRDNLNIYLSKPTHLEIIPKSSSKTSAIEFLLKRYKLDKSELITIRDNYNDMDMLEYAGLGIAMGNAPDEVKKVANDVILSNDEDGVAYTIDRYDLNTNESGGGTNEKDRKDLLLS
ncbi:hypothetical protein CPJCM30710_30500 [Clostridium polyendosporum]|uniref:Uncharacterized protein n=1 Tax=Clostridium polyendosporum TaxID=69208 RepID=A0A919S1Z6_9CLOT|nr:HAD family hydrolase [Clostridium polyendosporum]GIM30384.1 hypothetical protein CPJCM30710_30500 [Clostridium polyendosporum]